MEQNIMKHLVVLLFVIGTVLSDQSSPLFMWNVNSVKIPALSTVSPKALSAAVSPFLATNTMVVFLEKDLTNKKFVCTNSVTSKSCFARLQGVSGKNFYASVDRPVETLRSLSDEREYITVDASGKMSLPLELKNGKIIFVTFEDNLPSGQSETLEQHDAFIASLYSKLKDENVFFAYTSEVPSSHSTGLRRERRATGQAVSGFVFRENAELLLFYSSVSMIDGQGVKTDLSFTNMNVQKTNNTALSVTLSGGGSPLTFDVTLAGGYFYMKNVKLGNVAFRSTDVYSPTDFSYFCGNLTLYGLGTEDVPNANVLKWSSLQFQAPFGSTTNESFVFGDPWHCVGFFTGGILSGLLIVALLLSISFVGVCWMMDINTMDRFDDPKGKTITINASE